MHSSKGGYPIVDRDRGARSRSFSESAEGKSQHREQKETRVVVLHYHLFKNAGTSVDDILRSNFGARWTNREFPVPRRYNMSAVTTFVRENPRIEAISSHTALLPAPKIEGVEIFPIIFIRHPIDRLRSAYEFERVQTADTLGARLAKEHDLAGYVRELLRKPHRRQIRSFQTFRLSQYEPARKGPELERACRALEELPFVGLVECFDQAVTCLNFRLRSAFPDFRAPSVHRNAAATRDRTLAERLAAIEKRLGRELYDEVCAANGDDLTVYSLLADRFASASP